MSNWQHYIGACINHVLFQPLVSYNWYRTNKPGIMNEKNIVNRKRSCDKK